MSNPGLLLQGRLARVGVCPVLVVGLLFTVIALAGPMVSADAAPNI